MTMVNSFNYHFTIVKAGIRKVCDTSEDYSMSNHNPKVLEIIEIENHQERGLQVGGLVFETIKVNDRLSISETSQDVTHSFIVTTIHFYGHEMDRIDRGYTTWLAVTGDPNLLEGVKYLYRLD